MFGPGIKDIVNMPFFIIDKYTEITGISLGKIFVVDFIDTEAFRKAPWRDGDIGVQVSAELCR